MEGRCRDTPRRPGLDENVGLPRTGNETGSRHQWQDSPPSLRLSARTLQRRPLRGRELLFAYRLQSAVDPSTFLKLRGNSALRRKLSNTFATLENTVQMRDWRYLHPYPASRHGQKTTLSGDREDVIGPNARA